MPRSSQKKAAAAGDLAAAADPGADAGLEWRAVRLADYNPAWPVLFEKEKALVSGVLGSAVREIQHVGSTAVPGLRAKPVIDMATALDSLDEAPRLLPALQVIGYEFHPEIVIPGELFLRKTTGAFHLHLLEQNSPFWIDFLRFRDALEHNPAIARRYVRLKTRLASQFPHDRPSYTRGKAAFIEQVLKTGR
ncbi:MAG: GrpB family protein [Chloroflexi bacterium]|nr:GrpB family protein [Chloroflexota bacterium]